MDFDTLTVHLDQLVTSGELAGWTAGVADDADTTLASGGSRSRGGPPMSIDTVFAISSCTKPIAGALTMCLVDREVFSLDDSIATWLPEFADTPVLTDPDGPLDRTVACERPITVRDLLTMTPGFGWVDDGPLAAAMTAHQVAPGPFPPPMSPAEYLHRLGSLPLADQPGTRWRYHTSSDVLGVLLARATHTPIHDLLATYVTGPLGMVDTGFAADPDRMATAYGPGLEPFEIPEGTFTSPPQFESLATGLTSTVRDQLTFLRGLATGSLLSKESWAQMTTDHLTAEQRSSAEMLLDGNGWGLHLEIRPTSVGWAGGLGTIGYVDPVTGTAAALFTQSSVESTGGMSAVEAFLTLVD